MICVQCKKIKQKNLIINDQGQFKTLCLDCYEQNHNLLNDLKQSKLF